MSPYLLFHFIHEHLVELFALFAFVGSFNGVLAVRLARRYQDYSKYFFITDVFRLWKKGGRLERTAAITAAIFIFLGSLLVISTLYIAIANLKLKH
jgi:hypothetical protein